VSNQIKERDALRSVADHIVAARFLKEAAHPPGTPGGQAAWRARWMPWLLGCAPGPTGPTMIW